MRQNSILWGGRVWYGGECCMWK